MDFLFTILFIYLAYRGYRWYQNVQDQVKGSQRPPEVNVDADFHNPAHPQPGDENDYIEYEELKDFDASEPGRAPLGDNNSASA